MALFESNTFICLTAVADKGIDIDVNHYYRMLELLVLLMIASLT